MPYQESVDEMNERERQIYEELQAGQKEFEPSPIQMERTTIPERPPLGDMTNHRAPTPLAEGEEVKYITNEPASKAEWEGQGKKVDFVPEKPKPADLAAMKSLPEMQKFYIDNFLNGQDPRTNDYYAEASRAVWGNYSVSEQAAMDAKQKQAMNAQVITLSEQMKNRDMSHFSSATQEMFRHERNHQEKLAAQAEKIGEQRKLEIKSLETEIRSLERDLASSPIAKGYDFIKGKDRSKLSPEFQSALGRYEETRKQIDDLKAQKKSLVGGTEQIAKPTEAKTVLIDGVQYKDGDIVTKNGKQFRVRINK